MTVISACVSVFLANNGRSQSELANKCRQRRWLFECEIDAIYNSVHKVVATSAPREADLGHCHWLLVRDSQHKCVWKIAREWLVVDLSSGFAWFQVRRKRLMFTENGKKCDKYLVYPKAIYNHFMIHTKKEARVYLQLLMLLLIRKV